MKRASGSGLGLDFHFWESKLFLCSITLFILSLTIHSSECHIKLNVPRVRLPYFDTLSVNFTLEVETPGCYQWSVTRPDIITIYSGDSPLHSSWDHDGTSCSSQVIISAAPRISPCCPATAIVYVEDKVTKETVRCDVIIDKIVSISIETTTKELHMEEAPSKFYIQGHGSKGDTFSTVDGIPFKWWLESVGTDTSVDPQSIMRFMSFSESTYQAPPGVASLESRRLQGSTILVEGLKTGSARVFAKLTDPIYKNIQPASQRIVVVANLQVEPRDVTVVPDTRIPLQLRQIRHGKLVDIPLPSTTYTFQVLNDTVVSYDEKTSIITALNYGSTEIIVKDRNALVSDLGGGDDGDGEMEHPEGLIARINVREPKFLALTIRPHRNWALQVGLEYEVQVDLYDAENARITISDNILVATTFDPTYFRVSSSSENGTWHVGTPIKTGSAPVVAELKYLKKLDGSLVKPHSTVRVKAEMEIFQPVVIHPKETILPWDPNLRPKHEIKLTASGGNGNFYWSASNTSVVTVTQAGVAKTEWLGVANVTASMTINSQIRGAGRVYILPPTKMAILDHNVEAEIGVAILVPLAFYTVRPDDPSKTPVPYSGCKDFPFKVSIQDETTFRYDPATFYPPSKPACAYLPIIGSTLGSSLVTVTYTIGDITFSDSVTVSTFKPLRVIEPLTQVTVLAVGSSRTLAFEGGPRPLLEKHGFYRKVNIFNETVARATEVKSTDGVARDDFYVYRVLCTEIGETNLDVEVGIKQTHRNARPVSRVADVTVICAEPAQLYFKVESTLGTTGGNAKCPSDLSAAQVVRVAVPNYENTRVLVTVKDPSGRKFDNITSLNIFWSTSPSHLASVKWESWVITETVSGTVTGGFESVGESYQTLIPKGKSGNLELRAEITGYRKDVLSKLGLKGQRELAKLSADEELDTVNDRSHSMDLQLVADVQVDPSSLTLFNHAASKAKLRILEGSGHFEIETIGDGTVITTKYFESNNTLIVTPVEEGSAKIIIRDLCLTPRSVAEVEIRVNGIGSIEFETTDKLEVNHEANVSVTVYDRGGILLSPNILSLIELRVSPTLDTDILEVVPLDSNLEDFRLSQKRFTIRGKSLGQASLSFIGTADGDVGRSIRSSSKRITVFPPLSLRPKNITMLVGSVYQLRAVGGPQPDTNILYKVQGDDIATASQTGLVHGRRIGRTLIHASSVDRIKESNVFSMDTVEVNVVPLKGVRIQAPLSRIQTQKEMPLHIVGIADGLEPTVLLGDRTSLVSCEWFINNHESAEIQHVFQKNGFVPERGDQLGVRFRAKTPGRVSIKVLAVYERNQFIDEIEIEVYDELKLVKVHHSCENLLMTPYSELNLRTNRDPSAHITFNVQPSRGLLYGGSDSTDASASRDKPVVTVDSNGIVKSGDATGQAVIIVSVLEDFGIVLSITVTVDVKPVSYLMINPDLPIKTFVGSNENHPSNANNLPRGLTFPITISYHDNVGRTFDATASEPKIRSNRFDLVQMSPSSENNTFIAQALHEGRVCIKVYDGNNPRLVDYLVVAVGEAIEPRLPLGLLNVGDVICFSCVIKSAGLGGGVWTATPPELLKIHPDSGMGVAIAPGPVHVEYSISGIGAITSVDLNTLGISKIKFDPSGLPVALTNGNPSIEYDVFVILGDKKDNLLGGNCSSNKFLENITPPFVCNLRFENPEIEDEPFVVEPVFVFEKEQYACRIKVSEEVAESSYVNLINSRLILSAKVLPHVAASTYGGHGSFKSDVATDDLFLPFHPAINFQTSELSLLSNDFYTGAPLTLTGLVTMLDQIKMVPSDSTFIYVDPSYSTLSPFSGMGMKVGKKDKKVLTPPSSLELSAETRVYKVFLQPDFWKKTDVDDKLKLFVTIFSSATHQKVNIPVKIKYQPRFAEMPVNKETWVGLTTYLIGKIQEWLLIPFYLFLFTVFGHIVYKWLNLEGSRRKGETEGDAVFLSKSDSEVFSSTPKQQFFRDFHSRSSSGSPSSPHYHGGGDVLMSPASNSPLRPRMYSSDQGIYSSPNLFRKSTPH